MNCLQTGRFGCNEHNLSEEKAASEWGIVYLYYVNEQTLGSCPQMKFLTGSHQYSAVLDTGCEASILSEQFYNELKSNGVESLELPTQIFLLILILIYLSTAIGLTPGGSGTVHTNNT